MQVSSNDSKMATPDDPASGSGEKNENADPPAKFKSIGFF